MYIVRGPQPTAGFLRNPIKRTMNYTPRLSWEESGTGHFNQEQLKQLSTAEPKALIKGLLKNKDGSAVIYTMVELLRHGEGGIVLTLHANKVLMDLWENDMVNSNDYEQLVELKSFFKDHVREISFREQRR